MPNITDCNRLVSVINLISESEEQEETELKLKGADVCLRTMFQPEVIVTGENITAQVHTCQ